jgi:hypothetical protein
MEVDPTPITLPCLPLIGPTPSASGQNNCVKTSLDITGEEETGDTAASGSGTIPPEAALGTETHHRPTATHGGAARELADPSDEAIRMAAIQAFLGSPFSRSLRPLKLTTSMLCCRWLPKGPSSKQRSTSSTRHTQSKKLSAFGPHGPLTSCPHQAIRWGRPTLPGTQYWLHFACPKLLRRRLQYQQRPSLTLSLELSPRKHLLTTQWRISLTSKYYYRYPLGHKLTLLLSGLHTSLAPLH